jgi:spore coat protein U-like protein
MWLKSSARSSHPRRGPTAVHLAAALLGLLLWCGRPAPAEAAGSCSTTVTSPTVAVDVLGGGSAATTATLTFACSGLVPGLAVTLCPNLDSGSGGSNGSGGRYLANGAATIPFQIYQDAGHTQPWGSAALLVFGLTPTITVSPDSSGKVNTTATLYGQISAPSSTAPGTYASTFAGENFFWGLNLLSCAGITVGYSAIPAAFTFTATVAANCTVSATSLAFGTVGLLNAAVTAQNQVTARCTATTPYTVGLDNGLTGTSPTARNMTNGSGRVTYGIYMDSAGQQPWGSAGLGSAYVQSATGTGSNQVFTGYGLAPAQNTPAPASYSDTVVATVTY